MHTATQRKPQLDHGFQKQPKRLNVQLKKCLSINTKSGERKLKINFEPYGIPEHIAQDSINLKKVLVAHIQNKIEDLKTLISEIELLG